MDYFHKYKKYKKKYSLLKFRNIGGARNISSEIYVDKTKLRSIRDWEIEDWLIFLNIVLICAGIRNCYLYPSNFSIKYNPLYINRVEKILLQTKELKSLYNEIEYTNENIFIYNDESGYKKTEGILLKKKGSIIDSDKMGLGEDASKIDEKYIGEMLGFGECSGNVASDNDHQLLFPGYNGLSFMDFKCNTDKSIIECEQLVEFIQENQYLDYIFENNGIYFLYIINKDKSNQQIFKYPLTQAL